MPAGADAAALGVGAPLILSSLNIKDLHLQPAPTSGVGFVQMRWQEVKHNFAAQNRKKRFSPLRKESLFIIT